MSGHPDLDRIVHTTPAHVIPEVVIPEVVIPEQVIPATHDVRFASFARGGTGRFDLIVWAPTLTDMREVRVVHQLSKGQAAAAADAINQAFAAWLPFTGVRLVVREDGAQ